MRNLPYKWSWRPDKGVTVDYWRFGDTWRISITAKAGVWTDWDAGVDIRRIGASKHVLDIDDDGTLYYVVSLNSTDIYWYKIEPDAFVHSGENTYSATSGLAHVWEVQHCRVPRSGQTIPSCSGVARSVIGGNDTDNEYSPFVLSNEKGYQKPLSSTGPLPANYDNWEYVHPQEWIPNPPLWNSNEDLFLIFGSIGNYDHDAGLLEYWVRAHKNTAYTSSDPFYDFDTAFPPNGDEVTGTFAAIDKDDNILIVTNIANYAAGLQLIKSLDAGATWSSVANLGFTDLDRTNTTNGYDQGVAFNGKNVVLLAPARMKFPNGTDTEVIYNTRTDDNYSTWGTFNPFPVNGVADPPLSSGAPGVASVFEANSVGYATAIAGGNNFPTAANDKWHAILRVDDSDPEDVQIDTLEEFQLTGNPDYPDPSGAILQRAYSKLCSDGVVRVAAIWRNFTEGTYRVHRRQRDPIF